jgi:hypothetical protein
VHNVTRVSIRPGHRNQSVPWQSRVSMPRGRLHEKYLHCGDKSFMNVICRCRWQDGNIRSCSIHMITYALLLAVDGLVSNPGVQVSRLSLAVSSPGQPPERHGLTCTRLRVRRHKPTPRLLCLVWQSYGQVLRCLGQGQEEISGSEGDAF